MPGSTTPAAEAAVAAAVCLINVRRVSSIGYLFVKRFDIFMMLIDERGTINARQCMNRAQLRGDFGRMSALERHDEFALLTYGVNFGFGNLGNGTTDTIESRGLNMHDNACNM